MGGVWSRADKPDAASKLSEPQGEAGREQYSAAFVALLAASPGEGGRFTTHVEIAATIAPELRRITAAPDGFLAGYRRMRARATHGYGPLTAIEELDNAANNRRILTGDYEGTKPWR